MARNIKATIVAVLLLPFFAWIAPENNNVIQANVFCAVILTGILWILMHFVFSSDNDSRSNKMEI